MQYSLYELYSRSSLDLYKVRNHYLRHFYYQRHSKNDACKVLRHIVDSSKVSSLIQESLTKRVAPNYEDFLSTVCGMLKFMFKSNETLALASIDAALRWDIEVNSSLHLVTQEELKQDMIKVFNKFQIYEEMTEEEFHSLESIATVDAEVIEEQSRKELLLEHKEQKKTWSFLAFTKEFGSDVSVGRFHRKDDGEIFYSCIFMDDNKKKTFVGFSSKLGVLTADEISAMKDKLIIIKSPSGNYNLYKDNGSAWKKVKI